MKKVIYTHEYMQLLFYSLFLHKKDGLQNNEYLFLLAYNPMQIHSKIQLLLAFFVHQFLSYISHYSSLVHIVYILKQSYITTQFDDMSK